MTTPTSIEEHIRHAACDLPQLFSLREAVASLDLIAQPQVRVFPSLLPQSYRRVGILCGSFNPLTLAHTQLAEQVCQAWHLDHVFLSLAKVTIDKEQVTGMDLADRLALLSLYADRQPSRSMRVALVNRGLYVEQAHAFRSLLGPHTQLFFLTGMDKLVQILDARYYHDRDAALAELFGLASLIVANRGELSEVAFTELLDQPENQPFRSAIHFFPLSRATSVINELSATAIREALTAGRSIREQVPPETLHYVNATRAYHPPQLQAGESIDAYTVRLALLQLLYTARSWAEQEVNFQRLLHHALASTPIGQRLRQACVEPSAQAGLALLRSSLHQL